MSVKSRYYILLYHSSSLGTSPSFTLIKKKKEGYQLVILNSDLALFNQIRIT